MGLAGGALGRSKPSRGSARPKSRLLRPVVNGDGHLKAHLKKPGSSFAPSQATLYMNVREKEALRRQEKKELRRMVRRSMSRGELAATIGDAAARSHPMAVSFGDRPSSSFGRPNPNRSRPSTPDSIFGDGRPSSAAGARPQSASLSMGEAEDIVSAKDTAVWVGAVPDSVDEAKLQEIMSMFGEVSAVSLRTKEGNRSWGFVLFKEVIVARQVASYGTIAHEDHVLRVKTPDYANMSVSRSSSLHSYSLCRGLFLVVGNSGLNGSCGAERRHAVHGARLARGAAEDLGGQAH